MRGENEQGLSCQLVAGRLENMYGTVAARLAALESLLTERDHLLRDVQELSCPAGFLGNNRNCGFLPFPADILGDENFPTINIIDVGAQRWANRLRVYQPLVDLHAANVVEFRHDEDAASSPANSNSTVIANHVGSGSVSKFYVNAFSPASSLLASNMALLDRFAALAEMCRTTEERFVETIRLDDTAETANCDFLKVNVQGGELDVLQGAPRVLASCVAIHCETKFSPIYEAQPLFGDIDTFLRSRDFELIDLRNAAFATMRAAHRSPSRSRLLWADAIYMRTPESLRLLGEKKIVRAALIAHCNYGMYDIAAEFLELLDSDAVHDYNKYIGYTMAER